jgi:hypothetical protein
MHLARVEMTRAMNAVLDNLAGLRLDTKRPAPEIRGSMMRVPKHIHVQFEPVPTLRTKPARTSSGGRTPSIAQP